MPLTPNSELKTPNLPPYPPYPLPLLPLSPLSQEAPLACLLFFVGDLVREIW